MLLGNVVLRCAIKFLVLNMSAKTRVVLLCCGSFNPITNMHLRMFELARDFLHRTGLYSVVGGIISPVNDAYGKKDLISAKHRCEMVDLALKSSDWVRLDCWESDQETWQKTLNVLTHHQNFLDSITNANETDTLNLMNKKQKLDFENSNALNNQNGIVSNWDLSHATKLMLLCGADLLESFGIPGLWLDDDISEIVGKYGLVVITRQGANPQQFIYESDILSKYQNNIHLVTEWISNEISSTRIRRALLRNESVKYLLQDSVIHYIEKHSLYQPNNKYSLLIDSSLHSFEPISVHFRDLTPIHNRHISENKELTMAFRN